jgi:ubiquinone/menaquinone biosynthesis C-methylase UbiE
MNNGAMKQHQHDTWQSVAPGWARWDELLQRLTRPVTNRLAVEVRTGDRVLDIASGVGEPAITLAEHVGSSGSVVGTDLVEEMVAAARAHATDRGVTNVEFQCVDGERLDVEASSFDVVTIRWGLMFMPDPVACLKQARIALKPGGRLALSVWAGPDRNPWASVPMGVLARRLGVALPPPGTPGLFALADLERLKEVVEAAGFTGALLEELTVPMSEFEQGGDFLEYILDLAGPIAGLFAQVSEAKRQDAFDEIARAVEAAGGGSARLDGVTENGVLASYVWHGRHRVAHIAALHNFQGW